MPRNLESRSARVFVSSTFRDMKPEREILIKKVFPVLRKRCQEIGVDLTEVDLRWGVTEKDAEQGRVIQTCLEEIHNTRPFFIGILGSRYGWAEWASSLPDGGYKKELFETWPFLAGNEAASATELEILHGVLNGPPNLSYSYFYFRSDELSRQAELDSPSIDIPGPEPEAARSKLARLKNRIRQSGRPVLDGYRTLEEFEARVTADIWSAIQARWPGAVKPDGLDQIRMDHYAYARSRTQVYIGGEKYYPALDRYFEKGGKPILVTGASGVGKSALLSNWALGVMRNHPEILTILHFAGSTPDSGDHIAILRRIIAEIRERYLPGVKDDLPVKGEELLSLLTQTLANVPLKDRILIILDGLNQIQDRDNARELWWLPKSLPANVRLITSSLPGTALDELRSRGYPELEISPMDSAEERKELISQYLLRHTKKLSNERMDKIAAHPLAGNPLFLRVFLDELRVFGVHERLDERIGHYSKALSIDDLFELVLARHEEDYDGARPWLTRDAMRLIWASRLGLPEEDLLDLLGQEGQPLPRLIWTPLLNSLESHLVSRSGLLNFAHDFIRKAVEDRYLPDAGGKRKAHLALADHFEGKELDERKARESPWQLERAGEWESLKDCMADLELFATLHAHPLWKYELFGYWGELKKRGYKMAEVYESAVKRLTPNEGNAFFLMGSVSDFLTGNLELEASARLYGRILDLTRKATEDGEESKASLRDLSVSLEKIGGIRMALRNTASAMKVYEESLAIRRRIVAEYPVTPESLRDLSISLEKIGDIRKALSDTAGAMKAYEQSLAIARRIVAEYPVTPESLRGLSIMLNQIGGIRMALRDTSGAMKVYEESLDIRRRIVEEYPVTPKSLRDLSISLGRIGNILMILSDTSGAMKVCEESLDIRRRIVAEYPVTPESLRDLSISLESIGGIRMALRDTSGAMKVYEKSLDIFRRIVAEYPVTPESLRDLSVLLEKIGGIRMALRDTSVAMKVYEESLDIIRRIVAEYPVTPESLRDLSVSLNQIGGIRMALRDTSGAMKVYEESLAIARRIVAEYPVTPESLRDLSVSLNQIGVIRMALRDTSGAMKVYEESLTIARRIVAEYPVTPESLRDLSVSLNQIGVIRMALRDTSGAMKVYEEGLAIARRIVAEYHVTPESLRDLSVLLNSNGDIRMALRDTAGAMKVYEESLDIRRRIVAEYPVTPESLRDLSISLESIGGIRMALRDTSGAMKVYEESLDIFRRIMAEYPVTSESLRDLSISLDRIGNILMILSDTSGAMKYYEQSLAIRRRIVAEYPVTPESLRDLSVSLNQIGGIRMALRDTSGAMKVYEESLTIARRIVAEYPVTSESLRDLSISLNRIGGIRMMLRDTNGAMKVYEESLDIIRRIVAEYPVTSESLRDLSISLNRIGGIRMMLRDTNGAMKCYEESLDIFRRIVAEYPVTPSSLRDLSVSLNRIGGIRMALSDPSGAMKGYEESLAIRRRIVAEYPVTPESLRDLSISLDNIGKALGRLGKTEESQSEYMEAMRVCQQIKDNFGESRLTMMDEAVYLVKLGLLHRLEKDEAKAVGHIQQSLASLDRLEAKYGGMDYFAQVRKYAQALLNDPGKTDWPDF